MRVCTGTRFNHVYHGQSEHVLKDGRAQGVTYTRACTGTRFYSNPWLQISHH